jgi:hypothetical protein
MTTDVFGMSIAVHSHDWSTLTDAFGAHGVSSER